jgi:hypothetical protein
LKTFWNDNSNDTFTTATVYGQQQGLARGYTYLNLQGFVPI